MSNKLNWLEWIAVVLVIVGAINWGLDAVHWNLVNAVFGTGSTLATIIYVLVGLSGIYAIFIVRKLTKPAEAKM